MFVKNISHNIDGRHVFTIGEGIEIHIIKDSDNRTTIGINAPKDVPIVPSIRKIQRPQSSHLNDDA